MSEMICPACMKKQSTVKGEYHYLESGLTNVWLKGIEILKCECGEEVVSIPQITELHQLIAGILLEQENQLSGREIRFLRKHMGMKALDFAANLGVDKSTVSRWEHEKDRPSESMDRLIRLFYAIRMGLLDKAESLIKKRFKYINPEQAEPAISVPIEMLSRSFSKTC